MSIVFDPAKHCGAPSRRCNTDPPTCRHVNGIHHCRLGKGFKTDHPGSGNCKFHGGRTPNGRKHAARDMAQRALAKLGVPLGDGDPIKLLGDTVRHAQGLLEASSQAVLDALEPPPPSADELDAARRNRLQLEAALELYLRSIKEAHRSAKASVDANIAERMAVISERQADVILRALQAGLDAADVHGDPRAAAEAAMVKALRVKVPAGAELN